MIIAIPMFLFGLATTIVGAWLVVTGLANVLLVICGILFLLISAVLMSGCFIVVAILDLERAVRGKK